MPLNCSLCGREIDTAIENVIFYCTNCKPPQIYCSTCEREQLPRKGLIKKVVCVTCQKPIKLVKNLKKLPKEIQQLMESGGSAGVRTPVNVELVEDTEFVSSYGHFCGECGCQLIAGAQWCPECGAKVE
ncbi:MAG TPA: hypothetical protein VMV49_00055 [Candidatus Deferrimicrobium sp.]|nr:hypothetical protein [Candidatus Deferrimicrobium sp.]